MKTIQEHKREIRKETRDLLSSIAKWKKFEKIVFVLGGALISALASQFSYLYPPDHRWAFYLTQAIAAILVFIGALLLEVVTENTANAIERANELTDELDSREKEITSLDGDFRWFTRLYSTAGALKDMVESAVAEGNHAGDTIPRLGAMLDVVVAEKAILFGIGNDRWNFAIYLYDQNSDELKCVVCRRPTRTEEEAPHRNWKPGQGHVGAAFQMQREIVAGDTSDAEARAIFDSPDPSCRESDRYHYRSIASIPIKLASDPALGILVATSDTPQRFRLRSPEDAAMDPVEPLRILGSAIAFLLKTTDLRAEAICHEQK